MHEEVSYGYKKVPSWKKRRLILDHFDAIARRYDLADTLLSFGLHFYWRRKALQRLRLKPGDTVLDLCAGTADFALLAAQAVGPKGKVVVCDISRLMMVAGQQKAVRARVADRIYWVQGDAEQMGFDCHSFDAVIVGYGIRNFVFLEQGVREIYRVLKKGGKFMAMEFSIPQTPWIRTVYHYYSFKIIPSAGKLITGKAEPFYYLAESIRVFPPPDQIQALLTAHALVNVKFERLTDGLAVLYYGEKHETYKLPMLSDSYGINPSFRRRSHGRQV
jgi:demethylmenaquinone methyltransferase / 2-methoxy-6-polyprenyl-1,4-benzoquinol methylase